MSVVFKAVCTRKGFFYSSSRNEDIKYEEPDSSGRALELGDWVSFTMRNDDITTVQWEPPALPTTVKNDILSIETSVAFFKGRNANHPELLRGCSEELGDGIAVPAIKKYRGQYGTYEKMKITPMSCGERNTYSQITNEKLRWKVLTKMHDPGTNEFSKDSIASVMLKFNEEKNGVAPSRDSKPKGGLPPRETPKPKSINPKNRWASSRSNVIQAAERFGVVVGYTDRPDVVLVWTKECPGQPTELPLYDNDIGRLDLGTWLLLLVDANEAAEKYRTAPPTVLEYDINEHMYKTTLRNEQIQMRIPELELRRKQVEDVDGNGNQALNHTIFGAMLDKYGYLKAIPMGTFIDVIIVYKWRPGMQIAWWITDIEVNGMSVGENICEKAGRSRTMPPSTRGGAKGIGRIVVNSAAKNMERRVTYLPDHRAPGSTNELRRRNSDDMEELTSKLKEWNFEDLRPNEHIAFVESFGTGGIFVWIADDPQQSVIRTNQLTEEGPELRVGQFFIGTFTAQEDGRLICTKYERCAPMEGCRTINRKNHAVLHVQVRYSAGGSNVHKNKYLGDVHDLDNLMPSSATDPGQLLECTVSKRATATNASSNKKNFVWAIEAMGFVNNPNAPKNAAIGFAKGKGGMSRGGPAGNGGKRGLNGGGRA